MIQNFFEGVNLESRIYLKDFTLKIALKRVKCHLS